MFTDPNGLGPASDLVAEQRRIAALVRLAPLAKLPRYVVGVDAAYATLDGDRASADAGIGVGTAVVIDTQTFEVVEQAAVSMEVSVGYEPGLLAFREAPLLLAAIESLEHKPELIVCDGHGIAHPHRAGLACHVGIALDVPTIGCAKQRLIGTHEPVAIERGSAELITDDGDIVGTVLRTQDNVNPVFVSPGHLVDIATSTQAVLELAPQFRLPETTRAADQLTRTEIKKRIQDLEATS